MIRAVAIVTAQSLRRQPLRAAMAVLAVAAGVSLAVGVFAAQRSAQQSALEFGGDLAGVASLRVSSPAGNGGLPDDLGNRIGEIDGVAAAVPTIHTAVLANDSRDRETTIIAIGVDCRISALFEVEVCADGRRDAFENFDGVVLAPRLRDELGDDGVIRSSVGRIPVRDGVVVDDLDAWNLGRVALFSLPRAQELFARPASLDSIFIVPDDGVDVGALRADVQEAVGEWIVVGEPGALFRGADSAGPVAAALTIIGLLGLGIGALLVFNAVSLSLEERRRETATLSAMGGRPGTVLTVVLAEAGVLGLLGGLIGSAGAVVVERRLIGDLSRVVARISGVQLVSRPSMLTPLLGAVAGVVVAVAAAVRPARNAVRLDLGTELSASAMRSDSEGRLRPRRALVWGAVAIGAVAVSWLGGRNGSLERWQVALAYGGTFVTAPVAARACGLASPVILDVVRRRFGHRFSGRSAVALARLVREPGRTGAMTLAVVAAVMMGLMLASFRSGMEAGAADLAHATSGDRVVVSTMAEDNTLFIASTPSPALVRAVNDHPLVAVGHAHLALEIDLPTGADVAVQSFATGIGFQVYDGEVPAVADQADQVMIGPGLARHLGVRAGGTITVPGRHDTHQLAVSGVWANPSNQGFSISIRSEVLEEIWGEQPVRQVHVAPVPGVSAEELAAALRSSELDPDLRVWTPDDLAAGFAATWQDFFGPFESLQEGLIVIAVVAVVSTLLLVGVQRRREDGVLAALGLSPNGLARLALVEAGVITALGVVLGSVAGAVTIVATVQTSELLTGLNVPFRFAAGGLLTGGAALVVLIAAASLLPAWKASRLEVVDALQYE